MDTTSLEGGARPRRASVRTAAGILLLLATAVIHLLVVRGYLHRHPYVGWLFIADSAGAMLAAAGIAVDARGAWSLSALVGALPAIGFVLSRTIGLPMYSDDDWLEMRAGVPLGVLSLAVEVALVALCVAVVLGPEGLRRHGAVPGSTR
jgi:hypothetical protein